jgi:hypothetical protein
MVSANDPDIRRRLRAARDATRAEAIADDASKALDSKALSVGAQGAALMNVIDSHGTLAAQTADLARRCDTLAMPEESPIKTAMKKNLADMEQSRRENQAQAAGGALGAAHGARVEREERTLATLEGVRAELAAANEREADSESRERLMVRLTAASVIVAVIAAVAAILQFVL